MLADVVSDDAVRRSGVLRSTAAQSSMRGACCSDCEGLGDINSIAQKLTASPLLDTLFLVSLTIGAVAGGLSIYDHFKKRGRRRRRRRTARTLRVPVQSMHDLVYGDRDRAA